MAWNEPGGNGQDPWSRRPDQQGPPDLDELIKKMQDRLGGLFGGGRGSGSGGSDGPSMSSTSILIILVIVFVVWMLFGFYTVQPAEQGVEMRFGKHVNTTTQGLNWFWPYPVGEVIKVNVEEVRAIRHKALMLTQDENIVEIELVVQYQVSEADDYLFHVRSPDDTLRQATESALRDVVGNSKMDRPMESGTSTDNTELTEGQAEKARVAAADEENPEIIQDILTSGRAEAAQAAKILIQEILNRYETGLIVRSVNMQDAQPPEAVQAAFADAIKAREDEQRKINEAEAYSNQVIQRARGVADQRIQEAEAYKAQVTAQAKGETQRFLKVLGEYAKAPDVTRERLYLETMENVMGNVSKIMVDVSEGNQVLFLPLDRILGTNMSNNRVPHVTISPESAGSPSPYSSGDTRYQDDVRPSRGSDRRVNR